MFLHPSTLLVTMGVMGLLVVNTTVEAAVVSLKAVKINNVAITPTNSLPVRGGDTIEAEIFLSNWGAELPEGVRFFQVTLDGRAGFTSGDNGTILPLGWCAPLDKINCTTSAECPTAYPNCVTPWGCTCAGHNPDLGAYIAGSRSDWIFGGMLQLPFCDGDTSSLNYRFFCIMHDLVGVPDAGVPRYLGTLIVKVSSNACGTFTIGFVQEIAATFIADPSSPPNLVLPLPQPLLLTVSECCRIEFPCVPAHCNIDARIAHTLGDPLRLYNTNTLQMTFCDSTVGMTPDNFDVTVVPFDPTDIIPAVIAVIPNGVDPKIATVSLNRRIQEARWTCVRHIDSDRRCCIGSLPGDANNDRIRRFDDVFEIFDNLQGDVIPALTIEKCDIDRSLRCTPADLLMLVDLLNDPWLCGFLPCEDSLPVCPSDVPPP